MRKVPASVAVITVAHTDPETGDKVPMGIAVSSLNTVTLDPPTVSFNIKQPSQALNAIRDARGCFRVHFLAGSGASLEIIERFCNSNAYEERLKNLSIHIPQAEDSSAVTVSLAPQIQGNAVRAAAECILTHELTVGDHVILVAQIRSVETNNLEEPTIAYVNGAYRRLGSRGILGPHGNQQDPKQQDPAPTNIVKATGMEIEGTMNRDHELSIAYDWPGIPGETERHAYAERLRSYIKGMHRLRFINPRDIIRGLQPETRFIASAIGISLVPLVTECQSGTAHNYHQVVPEFHGRLPSAKMAKLIDRVKQLVKADRRFLEVNYVDLLRYLDVSVGGGCILPSDLLDPLRAEGLLPPFEPSASLLQQAAPDRNVLVLEQAENAIRNQLSEMTDRDILRLPMVDLMIRSNVPKEDAMHFRECHPRLKVEMCKTFFKGWKIDITGEVSPEEALVVMRRLVEYVGVDRIEVYQTHMREDTSNILRNIGVHPLIAGVNVHFILSKIRHLYSANTEDFSHLRLKVEEMLQPYFASDVTWGDLESRIQRFVQKFPLRATVWKNRDVLAAMGMSGNTTISTPLTETPKTINESNLLDMLMAKALKNHYGNGTDEENQAIATFLKDRYGFDVARKAAQGPTQEVLMRSSADDLEAARLQHQAETIPIRDLGT